MRLAAVISMTFRLFDDFTYIDRKFRDMLFRLILVNLEAFAALRSLTLSIKYWLKVGWREHILYRLQSSFHAITAPTRLPQPRVVSSGRLRAVGRRRYPSPARHARPHFSSNTRHALSSSLPFVKTISS